MNPKIQAVVEFMEANLNRELSLNELAQSANVSRSHLCHLFKTQTGVTPGQYLKSLRMQKARELLETTLLSLKQITAEVGLKDESHFMRDFKKAYGLTPSQYRANHFGLIAKD